MLFSLPRWRVESCLREAQAVGLFIFLRSIVYLPAQLVGHLHGHLKCMISIGPILEHFLLGAKRVANFTRLPNF